jgi:hypothetical protein
VHDRLSEQIATLPSLNKAQLLAIWAENFSKDPPPQLHKRLMVALLAYRIQEKEFGGLSHAARRRLREVAVSLRTDQPSQGRPDSAPQTGTRLLRVWHGETHEVIATGNGYLYRGENYSSLSRIAREITGTRWSGPLFFGVRKPWAPPTPASSPTKENGPRMSQNRRANRILWRIQPRLRG